MSSRRSSHIVDSPWYKSPFPWMIIIAVAFIAFTAAWFLKPATIPPKALRLSGYEFINPLLICNANNSRVFPENQSLSKSITSIINTNINSGNLSKGSVYFVDLANGKWINVHPSLKYFPASLVKIPNMIAYYEMAESEPGILNKNLVYNGADQNQIPGIAPSEAIIPGNAYTVEKLIEYMIKYSDSNAATLLGSVMNQNALNNVYNELNIPMVTDVDISSNNFDIITPLQIGELFRVLYNGTYISRDYSEKALQMMSGSSFTQGIVAGVPDSVTVSNKFGVLGITNSSNVISEHELHDCGIVYAKHSYLLCVMTRGSSDLATMEGIIANISKTAYENVEREP